MASASIVDDYFARIGYEGSRDPTLETLAEIHRRHPEAIPFENLNPFLGIPVALDINSLHAKLVLAGRGGYCYEHNLLLSHILRELGFSVTWLGARVLWGVPEGVVTPKTHMLMKIDLGDDAYVVDVGFGGRSMTAPLRLIVDVEQATPHGKFRLLLAGDTFVMQAQINEEWAPLYRFDLQEQYIADYEMTSWYLCNSPASRFIGALLLGRVDGDGRRTLLNTELGVHRPGLPTERRQIVNSADYLNVLAEIFKVRLTELTGLETKIQALIDSSSSQ